MFNVYLWGMNFVHGMHGDTRSMNRLVRIFTELHGFMTCSVIRGLRPYVLQFCNLYPYKYIYHQEDDAFLSSGGRCPFLKIGTTYIRVFQTE